MGIRKDDGSDKKSGDKFEDLVDRAAGSSSGRKPERLQNDDDESKELDLDDDDLEIDEKDEG